MPAQLKYIFGIFLFSCALQSYALQINVQSSSKEVSALGFTVNGENHGGAGSSYHKDNMPAGVYTFGVRVNGVFGKDVGCFTNTGKKSVQITKNATAILNYNGKGCTMKMVSGK